MCGGGGGYAGTTWMPTAKRPHTAEVVKANILGRLAPLRAKKGAGQLQTKTI